MTDTVAQGVPLGADAKQNIREAQIGLLYQFPARIFGHVINAALVVAVLWEVMSRAILLSWFTVMAVVILARFAVSIAFRRRRPSGSALPGWGIAFVVGTTITALLWGAATFIVWLTPDIAHHAFIAFVIAGTSAAVSATTYPYLRATYLFLVFMGLPLAANFSLVGGSLYLTMAFMIVLCVLILMGQSRVSHAILMRSLVLQQENRALVAGLTAARDNLEARVRDRTAELDRINENLRREMAARAETEAHLRQAQKMEAIGQLTGGVAHDFNNLLAVIQGNAELLREQISEETHRRELAAIIRASARGSELTNRLLAFASKDTLATSVVDVNDLLASMTSMLRRTIGSRVDMVFEPDAGPIRAQVNQGQLENTILNLALNARDAMAGGGRITIRTGAVDIDASGAAAGGAGVMGLTPGRYAMIEVQDTGSGIPEDVLDKVFEPFFTTKAKGQGTGLGLSMVYGFARQSGGHVEIESAEGAGTTIRLYLPWPAEEGGAAIPVAVGSDIPGGTESVLVIEDDADVRAMVEQQLQSLGYRVTLVARAEEAFDVVARQGLPDIILSDVLLPEGQRGPAVVAALQARFGPVRAVYMSGFAGDAFTSPQLDQGEGGLLRKPFQVGDLARQLRAILDRADFSG